MSLFRILRSTLGLRPMMLRMASSTAATASPVDLASRMQRMRFNAVGLQAADFEGMDAAAMEAQLSSFVDSCRQQGKNTVWLKVDPPRSALIAVANRCGFELHRTQNGFVHLMKWLPDRKCMVPPYATHQIGVGGVVFNSRGQVLAIRERNAVVEGYKLPGGLTDPGEDLHSAVEREIFEETGVRAAFESLVAFRQQHHVSFDISDIYFICRCRALSEEITVGLDEVAEVKWMELDELAQNTNQMVAVTLRVLEKQLQGRPKDAASTAVRRAGDNALGGVTAHLPAEMVQITMPSVVYTDRTFKLYAPSLAAEFPLNPEHFKRVKRIPNTDDHVM